MTPALFGQIEQCKMSYGLSCCFATCIVRTSSSLSSLMRPNRSTPNQPRSQAQECNSWWKRTNWLWKSGRPPCTEQEGRQILKDLLSPNHQGWDVSSFNLPVFQGWCRDVWFDTLSNQRIVAVFLRNWSYVIIAPCCVCPGVQLQSTGLRGCWWPLQGVLFLR